MQLKRFETWAFVAWIASLIHSSVITEFTISSYDVFSVNLSVGQPYFNDMFWLVWWNCLVMFLLKTSCDVFHSWHPSLQNESSVSGSWVSFSWSVQYFFDTFCILHKFNNTHHNKQNSKTKFSKQEQQQAQKCHENGQKLKMLLCNTLQLLSFSFWCKLITVFGFNY